MRIAELLKSATPDVTVLLADDDPEDVYLFQQALTAVDSAIHLVHCEDGEHSLDYLRRALIQKNRLPTLIFIDLNMPRADGKTLLRQIRGTPGLRHLPVVVFSTSDAKRDIEDCYTFGANSYIVKPANVDEMVFMLQKIKHYWFETVHLCPQ